MKSRRWIWTTAVYLFAALAMPFGMAAQDNPSQDHKSKHHQYKLIDTGTLGGAISSLGFEGERDINNRGSVVSLAETQIPDPFAPNCFFPDCFVGHAVAWRDGVLTDLGALPPVNNSGPIWISDSGLVAGFSENGLIDPLTGNPEFQAVLFNDGSVINLGTLGGNESSAAGVNDRGQAVGCAANAVPDAFGFCFGVPQQSRAFLWRNGLMRDLGTLGGPDALAELVNDRGQVAGWSLTNSIVNPATGIPTQHPFLWENGRMKDLGTIGGTAVYLINNLNERGQTVGGMNVAGDQSFHPFLWDGTSLRDLGTLGGDFGSADWISETGQVVGWACTAGCQALHAFLWSGGAMTDLGVFAGDPCSVAYVINSAGQIVGTSDDCSGNNAHAILWENGSMADLNALIPVGSDVQLTVGLGINEQGQIAAQGLLPNGDIHAFLLTPCDEKHPGQCEDYPLIEVATPQSSAPATGYPATVKQGSESPVSPVERLRNMMRQRYHLPGQTAAPRD
jgi:probable HAF family extracellular repeat protein